MSVRAIYEVQRLDVEESTAAMLVSFGFEINLADADDDPWADAHAWAKSTLSDDVWESVSEGPSGAVVDAWFASDSDALAAMIHFFGQPPFSPSTGQSSPATQR